jgi:hypothetical protein
MTHLSPVLVSPGDTFGKWNIRNGKTLYECFGLTGPDLSSQRSIFIQPKLFNPTGLMTEQIAASKNTLIFLAPRGH